MAFTFGGGAAPATSAAAPAAGGFSFGGAPAASAAPPAAASGFSFGAPAASSAFGAPPTSAPAFGAAAAPAFGAPQPAAAAAAPAFSFAAASAAAPATSAAPAFGGFGALTTTAQQQPQQQQQAVQFTRSTKFEELDKGAQDKLLQIQEQISKYASDQQKLLQLPHLQDASALQHGLDAAPSGVSGELRLLQAKIAAERDALEDFRQKAIRLLKATEMAVRTYERTKLWRDAANGFYRNEPLKPVQQELLAAPVVLPGPFLAEAVAGFAANVAEYSHLLDEVEGVLAASSVADGARGVDVVTALPNIVSNLHDYFIATAAKLERVHSAVQRQKAAYLARLRASGITADPFERLRRHEQHEQQQQQQRLAAGAAGGGGAHQLPASAGGLAGALAPSAFGASPQAAATPLGQPAGGFGGATPFGSPFPSTTPFGGGAAANGGLSRSNSKARSGKKR